MDELRSLGDLMARAARMNRIIDGAAREAGVLPASVKLVVIVAGYGGGGVTTDVLARELLPGPVEPGQTTRESPIRRTITQCYRARLLASGERSRGKRSRLWATPRGQRMAEELARRAAEEGIIGSWLADEQAGGSLAARG